MTTALLLAAGKATRLGALRNQYAKACVPVAGTTPLRFAIERLAQAGVTRVIVNLHWQAEQVRAAGRAAVPRSALLLALGHVAPQVGDARAAVPLSLAAAVGERR